MKWIKKACIIGVILIVAALYFKLTIMPTYAGRVTIDLSNNTLNTVNDIYISYEGSERIVTVPEIKPLERVILLLPNDIFSEPRKSQIYIYHGNEKYTLLEEYYEVTFAEYDNDVEQYAKATVNNNDVTIKDLHGGIFNLNYSLNLKPYFRIIELQ